MLGIFGRVIPLPVKSKASTGHIVFGTESTMMGKILPECFIIPERLQMLPPSKLEKFLHPKSVLNVCFILIRAFAHIADVILQCVKCVEKCATFVTCWQPLSGMNSLI